MIKTTEGILSFIYRNPPPEGEPAKGQTVASAWFEEDIGAIFGEPKFPVMWLQRIDGTWRIFKRASPDAEIEEIPWIVDPEPCTMEDLEERK